MANTLSQIGITSGSIVQIGHITQSIDAFTGIEEYDIILSGSLTVTGSIHLNNIITPPFQGISSFVQTSSYSTSGLNAQYSLSTSIAGNESIMLQLYHPPIDLTPDSYVVGLGEISTNSNIGGITYTNLSGELKNISISTTVLGSTSNDTSTITLWVGSNNYILPTSSIYSSPNQYIVINPNDLPDIPINAGDRIYVDITPITSISLPTEVIHTINLHIKQNG